jgi:hypothetical protein
MVPHTQLENFVHQQKLKRWVLEESFSERKTQTKVLIVLFIIGNRSLEN